MQHQISRRSFLAMALLPLAPGSLPAIAHSSSPEIKNLFINGHINAKNKHFVSGFDINGQQRFSLPLPGKAHGFAINPAHPNHLIALPSLPGTRMAVISINRGAQLMEIKSQPGRHFNGHGCFSPDGKYFFSSENIAATAEGVIAVRDGSNFDFIHEISAHGIGPHDIRLLPDGTTLVVAGGGIKTHPDSGKRELNINSMKSALLFIDTKSGALLKKREVPTRKLSIRHFDVGRNGEVLVACQYKGKKQMPRLVGLQQGEGEIEMLDIDDDNLWSLKNYTASARIAANGIGAVTCPRGDRLTLWNLREKRLIKSIQIKDVGGIEVDSEGEGLIVSANVGELYQISTKTFKSKPLATVWSNTKWTNHMAKSHA